MNGEQVPSDREIFHRAVALPPEQRAAFLDQVCGGEPTLREEVESLLQAHNGASSFMKGPAVGLPTGAAGPSDDVPRAERPGVAIGPYRLVEQIGEGGFGVVFLAEQTQSVRRRVALKIVKPGMDTREVIARFEVERQALALMDHPNIAKVFDAGATESGRPYFVMELVHGVPLTDYCDQCHLSIGERLALLTSVCQAVQHAHQKGVIHRDLKPTNVLVAMQDGRAAPKIIDFGVAKAVNQPLTERTLATGFAQMVGTPLYMSPEQAELSPLGVDTRSDIYSMGVLLYELLTGATPFDKDRLHAASYDELRRIIREEEPLRPSARLSTLAADSATTIAQRRRVDARRLAQTVRGDLDWIVMKCLEKDRDRRYETANALARDLERYLNDQPVEACPPSVWYRLWKFVRRNKGPAVVATLVVLLLSGGVMGTTIGLMRAERARQAEAYQRREVERERDAKSIALAEKDSALRRATEKERQARVESAKAKAVSDLLEEMLELPSPGRRKGPDYTVRELLDDFSVHLGDQLRDQPEAEIAIRTTIGRTYLSLGLREQAETHLLASLELRRNVLGPDHVEVALGLLDYAQFRHLGEDNPGAEALAREALVICQSSDTAKQEHVVQALLGLQRLLALQGKHVESKALSEQALALAREMGPAGDHLAASVLHHLASSTAWNGDPVAAEVLAREAVALHRQVHGDLSENTAWALVVLGDVLDVQGKRLEAVDACSDALAIFRELHFDEWSRNIRFARKGLRNASRTAAADDDDDDDWLQTMITPRLAKINTAIAEAPEDLRLQVRRAGLLLDFLRIDEAIATCSDVLQRDPAQTGALSVRGDCYIQSGRYAEAAEDFSKALRVHPNQWWFLWQRSLACQQLGNHAQAIADLDKGIELIEHEWRQWVRRAESFRALGRWEEAENDHTRAIEIDGAWEAWRARGLFYAEQGRWNEAAADLGQVASHRLAPDVHKHRYERALVSLARRDSAGYQSDCAGLFERAAKDPQPGSLNWAVWSCVVSPDSGVDPVDVIRFADRLLANEANNPEHLLLLGAALHRAGQFPDAVRRLTEAEEAMLASEAFPTRLACCRLFRSLAQQRMEQSWQTLHALQQLLEAIEMFPPTDPPQRAPTNSWDRRLTLQLLCEEARLSVEMNQHLTKQTAPGLHE